MLALMRQQWMNPLVFPLNYRLKSSQELLKNNDGPISTAGDADLIGLRKGLGGSIFLSSPSDVMCNQG